MMFSEKQMQIIKQVLTQCDNHETLALVGDTPIKYQFTKEFEEKADALKRRVIFNMTVTLKRLLIAAAIIILALTTTLVLAAWPRDSELAIRFGNAVTEYGTRIASYPDTALDCLVIDYENLPVPEGYLYRGDSYNHASYQKQFEDGTWGPSISVAWFEIFDDSYVLIEHDGNMERIEVGDTTVYYYSETWVDDSIGLVIERNRYLVKGEKYITYIITDSSPKYGREDLASHEEIATIAEALNDVLK